MSKSKKSKPIQIEVKNDSGAILPTSFFNLKGVANTVSIEGLINNLCQR